MMHCPQNCLTKCLLFFNSDSPSSEGGDAVSAKLKKDIEMYIF